MLRVVPGTVVELSAGDIVVGGDVVLVHQLCAAPQLLQDGEVPVLRNQLLDLTHPTPLGMLLWHVKLQLGD